MHNRLVNGSGGIADIVNDYATGVGRTSVSPIAHIFIGCSYYDIYSAKSNRICDSGIIGVNSPLLHTYSQNKRRTIKTLIIVSI